MDYKRKCYKIKKVTFTMPKILSMVAKKSLPGDYDRDLPAAHHRWQRFR